jgi:hypothetical protein
MRTILATFDRALTVFEQIAISFGREEHEELLAMQLRMQTLHALTAKLQQQVQTAVIEDSKRRCRRKPILRDRDPARVARTDARVVPIYAAP